jgi:hypothetical protein
VCDGGSGSAVADGRLMSHDGGMVTAKC